MWNRSENLDLIQEEKVRAERLGKEGKKKRKGRKERETDKRENKNEKRIGRNRGRENLYHRK